MMSFELVEPLWRVAEIDENAFSSFSFSFSTGVPRYGPSVSSVGCLEISSYSTLGRFSHWQGGCVAGRKNIRTTQTINKAAHKAPMGTISFFFIVNDETIAPSLLLLHNDQALRGTTLYEISNNGRVSKKHNDPFHSVAHIGRFPSNLTSAWSLHFASICLRTSKYASFNSGGNFFIIKAFVMLL